MKENSATYSRRALADRPEVALERSCVIVTSNTNYVYKYRMPAELEL